MKQYLLRQLHIQNDFYFYFCPTDVLLFKQHYSACFSRTGMTATRLTAVQAQIEQNCHISTSKSCIGVVVLSHILRVHYQTLVSAPILYWYQGRCFPPP